jgi:hypothetical protein
VVAADEVSNDGSEQRAMCLCAEPAMRDCWAGWACRTRGMQSQEGGEGAGHAGGSHACEGAKRTLYSGISTSAGISRCGHQSAAGEASSSKEVLWSRRLVVTRSNWRGSCIAKQQARAEFGVRRVSERAGGGRMRGRCATVHYGGGTRPPGCAPDRQG